MVQLAYHCNDTTPYFHRALQKVFQVARSHYNTVELTMH